MNVSAWSQKRTHKKTIINCNEVLTNKNDRCSHQFSHYNCIMKIMMMITVYFHIMNLSNWLETLGSPIQQTILGPNWRAPPGPRSGRVAKQRELAKRVVAKQPVCAADKERAAQSVATACASSGLWLVFSTGVACSGLA